jgi:hypothetical protein
MTPLICVLLKELGRVEQMRACQTGKLLAGLTSPPERPDVQDRGEMVEKSTVISRST